MITDSHAFETGLRRWTFDKDAMLNCRDLGGYICDGGMTAYNRIFRGDQPHGLSERDITKLKAVGLAHVIDLRSDREKEAFPNAFENDLEVGYHEWYMPIGSKDLAAMGPQVTCQGENYVRRMAASGDYYARLLTFIAGLEGTVMFHCTAGKDRTGIVAGLILMLLGVADTDIIADYQVSEAYISSRTEFFREFYPNITDWELAAEAQSMKIMVEWLRSAYGGAAGYLKKRGMKDDSIEKLRAKMLKAV